MFGFLRDKFSNQPLRGSKSFKERILSNELLSSSFLYALLTLVILTNLIGLFFPVLASNDANLYAVVAKNIVINHDWINLTYAGQDWIDKPHFPFWVIAISYKIFGISTFSYILPGFLFNLLGARYTYLLAKKLYTEQVAILSSVIYLSALHLMLSAIDVRTEAYLLGEIIPAVYYLYLYNQANNIKYMLLTALFSALAIMTKGVFVLIVIYSGIITLWLYNKNYANFKNIKWLKLLVLTFILIIPELIALYVQFDLHPEKYVLGQNNLSGVRFFFLDGQLGRFFNFGLIHSEQTFDIKHLFYYISTFVWSFVPWSILFFISLWDISRDLRLSNDLPKVKEQKSIHLFLLGSFFPIFIIFSLSLVQLDSYINIIFPFAAIICANWVCNKATRFVKHPVFTFQVILSFILLVLLMLSVLLLFNGTLFTVMMSLCVICLSLFSVFINNRDSNKAVSYPVLVVCMIFIFMMLVNGRVYQKYDAGYHVALTIESMVEAPVINYGSQYSSLEFHINKPYMEVDNIIELNKINRPFYLLIESGVYAQINQQLLGNKNTIDTYKWINQDDFSQTLFNLDKRLDDTKVLMLLFISSTTKTKVIESETEKIMPVVNKPSAGEPKTKTKKVLVNTKPSKEKKKHENR